MYCALKVDDYREGKEPAGTTREQVVGAMALYRWAPFHIFGSNFGRYDKFWAVLTPKKGSTGERSVN